MPEENDECTHLVMHLESSDSTVSAGEQEEALRQFASALSQSHNIDVERQTSQAPDGVKSGTGMLLGLAIVLAGRRGAADFVAVVQEWLHRHADLTLKVEMGDLKLELSIAGPTERAELAEKLQRLKNLTEEDSEDETAEDSDDDDDDDDDSEGDPDPEGDDDSGDDSKDDSKTD
jgi:hypothetical protein